MPMSKTAICLNISRIDMSRPKDKGRIEGPFVPMLIDTMASPAWKAMSPYARVVYVALRSRYGHKIKNNGRIYLSARDGAEETGFDRNRIARSLRELAHYGFIVATKSHCLGVDGRGVATHWRLTELGYMHDPPTRDFMRWDGELFHEQKSPAYYKRQERNLAKLRRGQKQNPVTTTLTDCHDHTDIPVSGPRGHLLGKVSRPDGHINGSACHDHADISRVNHSVVAPDAFLSALDPLAIAVQRQRLDALSARLAVFGDFGGVKIGSEKISAKIASVSTLGTSTLGTLDAGLIVRNPGVA
jgi:hypothetical protein